MRFIRNGYGIGQKLHGGWFSKRKGVSSSHINYSQLCTKTDWPELKLWLIWPRTVGRTNLPYHPNGIPCMNPFITQQRIQDKLHRNSHCNCKSHFINCHYIFAPAFTGIESLLFGELVDSNYFCKITVVIRILYSINQMSNPLPSTIQLPRNYVPIAMQNFTTNKTSCFNTRAINAE